MQKENKSDNHDPASDSPEQSYILPGICIGMILGMLLGFAMGSLVFHNIILGLVCWSLPWHCGRRCHSKTKIISRQHRTEFVRKMRSRIFRQIAQKFRRHTVVCQEISVWYDGKSASRLRAKPSGGLCAVLPLLYRVFRRLSTKRQGVTYTKFL